MLLNNIRNSLRDGMVIPNEMEDLYTWIEKNNFIVNNVGYLGDDCPTKIEFTSNRNSSLKYWFGHDNPDVLNKIFVFCKTGADGSMGAFWLAPDGQQKIVHLGSGSGSIMVCILADNFLDFMKLLAIGYDEIAWDYDLKLIPDYRHDAEKSRYVQWLKEKYKTSIPFCGMDIVKNISLITDANPIDEFAKWVKIHNEPQV